jgi:anaerobic selenocysteine-containing dehydrogenase
VWHPEDILEIHEEDAENRGIKEGDLVSLVSRAGETSGMSGIQSHCRAGDAGHAYLGMAEALPGDAQADHPDRRGR